MYFEKKRSNLKDIEKLLKGVQITLAILWLNIAKNMLKNVYKLHDTRVYTLDDFNESYVLDQHECRV